MVTTQAVTEVTLLGLRPMIGKDRPKACGTTYGIQVRFTDGNVAKIPAYVETVQAQGADLVVFPELAVPGFCPQDLLLKPQCVKANLAAFERAAAATQEILGFDCETVRRVIRMVDHSGYAGIIAPLAATVTCRSRTGTRSK